VDIKWADYSVNYPVGMKIFSLSHEDAQDKDD